MFLMRMFFNSIKEIKKKKKEINSLLSEEIFSIHLKKLIGY